MHHALRRLTRVLGILQTGWTVLGITLILVLLTEAGFRLAFAVRDHFGTAPQPDPRVLVEGYAGATWPVEHYRELESLEDRWLPYVYFRQKPFQGLTITIGPEGLRTNWAPPPASVNRPNRKVVKLLMLGGSSLWGFGARNDQTIPSLVARDLHELGYQIELRNLAEIGYVSTQEVIALFREIQSGYRPDFVVFFDGVNDTTSALLEGEAGLTTNEVNRRKEFNLLKSPGRLTAALITNVMENAASYRFAQAIGRRFLGEPKLSDPARPDEVMRRLADEIVRRYEANLRLVETLGRAFNFRPFFYWQPTVFTKPQLVPFEREEAGRYGWSESIFRQVHGALRTSAELQADPAFHDLSRIFADSKNLVFIDYCHTTESANARIAAVMAHDLMEALKRSASDLPTPQP
jgi:hypothetical protein